MARLLKLAALDVDEKLKYGALNPIIEEVHMRSAHGRRFPPHVGIVLVLLTILIVLSPMLSSSVVSAQTVTEIIDVTGDGAGNLLNGAREISVGQVGQEAVLIDHNLRTRLVALASQGVRRRSHSRTAEMIRLRTPWDARWPVRRL